MPKRRDEYVTDSIKVIKVHTGGHAAAGVDPVVSAKSNERKRAVRNILPGNPADGEAATQLHTDALKPNASGPVDFLRF